MSNMDTRRRAAAHVPAAHVELDDLVCGGAVLALDGPTDAAAHDGVGLAANVRESLQLDSFSAAL